MEPNNCKVFRLRSLNLFLHKTHNKNDIYLYRCYIIKVELKNFTMLISLIENNFT